MSENKNKLIPEIDKTTALEKIKTFLDALNNYNSHERIKFKMNNGMIPHDEFVALKSLRNSLSFEEVKELWKKAHGRYFSFSNGGKTLLTQFLLTLNKDSFDLEEFTKFFMGSKTPNILSSSEEDLLISAYIYCIHNKVIIFTKSNGKASKAVVSSYIYNFEKEIRRVFNCVGLRNFNFDFDTLYDLVKGVTSFYPYLNEFDIFMSYISSGFFPSRLSDKEISEYCIKRFGFESLYNNHSVTKSFLIAGANSLTDDELYELLKTRALSSVSSLFNDKDLYECVKLRIFRNKKLFRTLVGNQIRGSLKRDSFIKEGMKLSLITEEDIDNIKIDLSSIEKNIDDVSLFVELKEK